MTITQPGEIKDCQLNLACLELERSFSIFTGGRRFRSDAAGENFFCVLKEGYSISPESVFKKEDHAASPGFLGGES